MGRSYLQANCHFFRPPPVFVPSAIFLLLAFFHTSIRQLWAFNLEKPEFHLPAQRLKGPAFRLSVSDSAFNGTIVQVEADPIRPRPDWRKNISNGRPLRQFLPVSPPLKGFFLLLLLLFSARARLHIFTIAQQQVRPD